MRRLRDENFEHVTKPQKLINWPAKLCSNCARTEEAELGAGLVSRLIDLGREKLTVNVEAGGIEYRIVVERRRTAPVLHERW